MKSIFLCNDKKKCTEVFAASVTERIRILTENDGKIYSKADVISSEGRFADTEIIFSTWGMPAFTEEEIKKHLPSLRCVFYAAGTVQGFARPFLGCGVRVFSAWAANAIPVAEYAVAQIILAGKDFYCQTRLLSHEDRCAAAERRGGHFGNYRKRIGLLGCGMIGSRVAEMLKSYELEVYAFDPFLSEERAAALGVTLCTLEGIFSSCAVVSNHLANNEKTRSIIRYGHFASMPKYATFINTGRGAQVDEEGLVKALTERPDLCAVLDVTYPEPSPAGHPFYSLPNCFLTPHIAGSLGGEVVRMAEYMADEFALYSEGKACRYEVTPEMLERMA